MDVSQLLTRAETLMSDGRLEEAAQLYADLCAMEHLTDEELANSLFGMGTCHFLAGQPESAARELQRSWELLYKHLGMQHPQTARVMVLLSRALFALGSMQSGMEVGRGALQNLEALYGKEHEQTATAAFFLADGARASGHYAMAEDLVRQAMEGWSAVHGAESLQVAMCLDALGSLHNACGEKREAADCHTKALDIKFGVLGDCPQTATASGALGIAEENLENWEAACRHLTRAVEILSGCEDEQCQRDCATFAAHRDNCLARLNEGENHA